MVFRIGLPTAARPRSSELAQRALVPDATARAAGFGRWWYAQHFSAMILSQEAAILIGETPGVHARVADCFAHVVPDDLVRLTNSLAPGAECEFRILTRRDGLRWLRLTALPATSEDKQAVVEGILVDITAMKLAAMREQFSFESTQLMIGASTLDEAISKMIALVCTNLGWECGMYWSVAQSGSEVGRLVLSHYWSGEARPPSDVFEKTGGHRLSIAPREGVVGAVWSSGKARWIEDIATDPEFLYPDYARQAGIHSGYAFPVAYDSDDGRRHRPGVLIFFSCLSRQRTAQLPKLSEAIGGLIAHTAQRMAQQAELRELSQVDALSGLANRRHFHDLLDGACHRAVARQIALGVLFIDLDRFRSINDCLGQAVGDAVLHQFAQRLTALAPRGGYAGRVGGDQFALFMYPGDSPERMREMVDKVLIAARTRFVVEGRELVMSASVGVSLYPKDGATSAELLRNADSAMCEVKRGGRNGVSFYSGGSDVA